MKYNDIPTKTIGIYKINFPNQKIYIGRAKDIKYRIWEHYAKQDNTACQDAIYKYFKSYQDIDIDILETFETYNHKQICEKEIYWVEKYSSFKNKDIGYNLTPGGDGGAPGTANPSSKFSDEGLQTVIRLLRQGKSNIEIAAMFDVHPDTIGHINQGKTYFNELLEYPIRKINNNAGLTNGSAKESETYDTIIYLLSSTLKTYKEIAEETSTSIKVVGDLNLGKHFYCSNIQMNFPIRTATKRSKKVSAEDLINIENDLLNSSLSIIDISKKYGFSRDTIGDINQGKRHRNEKYSYPLRKNKKPVSTSRGSATQGCY